MIEASISTYLIDVTSHPLATADLQILEPRNPLPPQTIIFFALAVAILPFLSVMTEDCNLNKLIDSRVST